MSRNPLFRLLTITLLLSPQCYGNSLESALSLFNSGQYDLALTQFEVLKNEEDPDTIFYLARSYFRLGQLTKAKKLFEENVEDFPLHARSHFLLGSVKLNLVSEVNVFRKWGLAKSALASWQRSLELDPNNIEAIYGVASFYLNAPALVGGDKEKADIEISKLFKLEKAYGNLLKASIKQKTGEGAEAERLIISAVNSISDRAFPTLILADFYRKEQRFEDALMQIEKYRNRKRKWNDPGIGQTALLAGKIYTEFGKTELAHLEFDTVIHSKAPKNILKLAKAEIKNL